MKSGLYINGRKVDTSTLSGKKSAIKLYLAFVVIFLIAIAILTVFNVLAFINTNIKKYGTLTEGRVTSTIVEKDEDGDIEGYKISYIFERRLNSGETKKTEKTESVKEWMYRRYRVGDSIAVKYDEKGRSILAENYSTNFFENAGFLPFLEAVFVFLWIVMLVVFIKAIIDKNIYQRLENGEGVVTDGYYLGMTYDNNGKRGIKYSWADSNLRTHEGKTGNIYDEDTANFISKQPNLKIRYVKKCSMLILDIKNDSSNDLDTVKAGKVVCEYCGSSFSNTQSKCPNCGAKIK